MTTFETINTRLANLINSKTSGVVHQGDVCIYVTFPKPRLSLINLPTLVVPTIEWYVNGELSNADEVRFYLAD